MKNELTQKHAAAKSLAIGVGILFIITSIFVVIMLASIPEQEMTEYIAQKEINGITWNITWTKSKNRPGTEWELKHIDSMTTYNEKISSFYQELAQKYGDSSVYVTHQILLYGVAIEDNWYSITETIIKLNGWDTNEVLYSKRTRYEEQLFFDYPPAYIS